MESRAKAFGHPVHPMLIVFPVGLFIMAIVCDIIFLIGNNPIFSTVAFYDIAGGIIGGLLAAVFGLRDYLAIPSGTRAKHIGAYHGVGNLVIVVLFLVSWLLRLNTIEHVPPVFGYILSFAGIILAGLTAWLGGELVDRMGVGVDPGANLDAPSSLSGEPAMQGMETVQTARPVTGSQMPKSQIPVTGEDKPEEDEP